MLLHHGEVIRSLLVICVKCIALSRVRNYHVTDAQLKVIEMLPFAVCKYSMPVSVVESCPQQFGADDPPTTVVP